MTFVSHAQNFEDVMLWRAFSNVPRGWYIDIGAHDPDVDSVTRAFYDRNWCGLNVEPLEREHARLTERRPRDVNLRVAVGAHAGTQPFFVNSSSGLSTLSQSIAENHSATGLPSKQEMVPVRTLTELCSTFAPPVIHFLKIDVEGAEEAVLRGADFASYRPWIVLVEATLPTNPAPSYMSWEPLLIEAGYRFAWFDGLNRFYIAEEHKALEHHFVTPPNVFDEFVLAKQVILPPSIAAVPLPAALSDVEERRINMAARCRDADTIPKTPDAGLVRINSAGTRVQVMHNGLHVLADGYYGSWMTSLIERCHGHHEPQEERLFHEVVSRLPVTATMLELGGYWSFYSLWFLQGGSDRQAIVVEPDPAHRAVGEANATLNGLSPVFVSGFVGGASTPPVPFQTEGLGEVLIPCLTVPQLLRAYAVEILDVLHCDVQGAELAVLEGCAELFAAGRIRFVFVSTHAREICGTSLMHQKCLALLRAHGAFIEAEHDVHESFSGDGLIVARFGPPLAGLQPVQLSCNRYSESLFRNPIFDLEAVLAGGIDKAEAVRLVAAAHRALKLDLTGPECVEKDALLLQSQGLQPVLANILARKDYLVRESIPAASALLANSGVWLTLTRDGPLGRQGQTLLAPRDAVMLPTIQTEGVWHADAVTFLSRHLDQARPHLLLDIGANIGLFSRQVMHLFPSVSSVWAVEPDPANFTALEFNLRLFAHDRHMSNVALGIAAGRLPFYRDTENFGNYSLNLDAMRGRSFTTTEVEVVRVQDWFASLPANPHDIIWKSDTQGMDEVIVSEVPWEIWKRVSVAVIELWRINKAPLNVEAFRAKLEDMPNRSIGSTHRVSIDEILEFLVGDDWHHDDLYLWR